MKIIELWIPYKFPSLNQYVNECRKNRFAGAKMKKDIQYDISFFIARLPKFEKPVKIEFVWYEENKRRDLDNVAFAKKFILDSLVENGKLKDDNRRFVTAFSDDFKYEKKSGVLLKIIEISTQ